MLSESRIAVRYPDCDPMGIVHHAVYPIWYEIARMDFFEKVGFSYSDMNAFGINPPMVNLNLQYGAPVRYPGQVTVRTVCTLAAGKKLELRYNVYQDGNPTPVATATSFHIWTGPDMKSLDLSTLPEAYAGLQKAVTRPAVLILSGGKSSRMGHDKAKAVLGGKTLLERAVTFWQEALPGAPVYIAAGQPEHFESLPEGTTPVYDIYQNRGPLGGLHGAMKAIPENLLMVSAVDMPMLKKEAFQLLKEKAKGAEDICVFQSGGRPEPLFGLYRNSCLPVIEELLESGNNRMSQLLSRCYTTQIPLPEEGCLSNVNTPEDLQKALESLT